ncbi:MAG: hypothetical protein HRU40_19345 [Saprospiraceae bacterium]|nr:hypothetical protein [Saprospiraceae bacterium]
MNIFECTDHRFGSNKTNITRLINEEITGNIAPTTISRIYEGNAKESLTALVKYTLFNILTRDIILDYNLGFFDFSEKDIYIECPEDPEFEQKINEWHRKLTEEQRVRDLSQHVALQVLDEYSSLDRTVRVMLGDYAHDKGYPHGYVPSYNIFIDKRSAKYELVRDTLKEWLI